MAFLASSSSDFLKVFAVALCQPNQLRDAGPVAEDPYNVDGLSGATITSRGVTNLVRFWLGEDGFGPYLASYRAQAGV
mgnify:CR=1 FL=1